MFQIKVVDLNEIYISCHVRIFYMINNFWEYWLPSSTEVKKAWSYTSTHLDGAMLS